MEEEPSQRYRLGAYQTPPTDDPAQVKQYLDKLRAYLSLGPLTPEREGNLRRMRERFKISTETHYALLDQVTQELGGIEGHVLALMIDVGQRFTVGQGGLFPLSLKNCGQETLERCEFHYRFTHEAEPSIAECFELHPEQQRGLNLQFTPPAGGKFNLQVVLKTTDPYGSSRYFRYDELTFDVRPEGGGENNQVIITGGEVTVYGDLQYNKPSHASDGVEADQHWLPCLLRSIPSERFDEFFYSVEQLRQARQTPAGGVRPPRGAGDVVQGLALKRFGLELPLRFCPSGEFMMGSDADPRSAPRHSVRLTRSFLIAETTVTQEMWERVMGPHHSKCRGARHPVTDLTWGDVARFCNKLSELEGLDLAYRVLGEQASWNRGTNGYRVPTEAEWEYAAGAGQGTRCAGSDWAPECAWTQENTQGGPEPVAQKKPNAWGLYDMSGNVWEWCSDIFQQEPYADRLAYTQHDPFSDKGIMGYRGVKGGSWCYPADRAVITSRSAGEEGHRSGKIGLRLVRTCID